MIDSHETMLTLLVFFGSYPLLYAVNVMLSRALGAADYGDFAVTRSVATLTATLALLGLNSAALKLLPVYRKQGANDAAKGYILLSLVTIVLMGMLLSLLGAGTTALFFHQSSHESHPIQIAMLWVLPLSIGLYSVSLLNAHQQIVLGSVLSRVVLPLITALRSGVVFLTGRTLTDFSAVGLLVFARIVLILILVRLLWSIWRREYRAVAGTYQVKHWAIATMPFLLSTFVIAALGQSSTLILEMHHPSEDEVGVYAAVQQVAGISLLALGAITTVAMPRLALLLQDGAPSAQLERQLGSYLRILSLAGVVALLAFIFAGNFLLGLFGHQFQDGHLPLVVLGIGYLVVLVGGLIVPILQVRQETRIVTATMLTLLALNVGFTYLLAPRYGALGAALAYTISTIAVYTVQFLLLQRSTGIPYLRTLLPG